MSATTTVAALAELARAAARTLTVATGAERAAALNDIADEIESRSAEILAANKVDIDRGIAEGMHPQLQDRLLLTAERVKGIASGARQVAALEDP
ncbi:MAG: gamma-glutamyl-phosphate reductase, partial [Actinobacteria bacterium]|nr:gamma-glutamyl-phosphate reductase [Actinomycetota bacterium]